MKKVLSIILLLVNTLVYAVDGDLGASKGANGSETAPWLIEDFSDFQAFCADTDYWTSGVYAQLKCDIDLSYAGTYSQAPIAGDIDTHFGVTEYYGSFDGNGHTISNLIVEGAYYCGLFGKVGFDADITNLGLINASVTGIGDYVGGLCGFSSSGSITKCYVSGYVSGTNYIGGLVGENDEGSITNCYSAVSIIGNDCVGGLIGNNGGSVTDSFSTGSISGNNYIGGLCGYIWHGSLIDCFTKCLVEGNASVGGLCGDNNSGDIVKCSANNSVTGNRDVGGLCGSVSGGIINQSYTDGYIVCNGDYVGGFCGSVFQTIINDCYSLTQTIGYGDYVGGFCGLIQYSQTSNSFSSGYVFGESQYCSGLCGCLFGSEAIIQNCFWNTETSGQSDGYILYSLNPGNVINVMGLTTSELQTRTSFIDAGWDFVGEEDNGKDDIWQIRNYPVLSWQFNKVQGSGSEEDPYVISNLYDFYKFCFESNYWASGVHTQLVCNLDLINAGVFTKAPIAGDIDIHFGGTEYCGSFDGNGHTISNLTVEGAYCCGLFGKVGSDADITNLGLKNVSIIGTSYVGGLCGYNDEGSIIGCFATGIVAGVGDYSDYVGGLCGFNNKGSVTDCYSMVSVSGDKVCVGGLCGFNSSGSITKCYASGPVSGVYSVGGLCGFNNSGIIIGSFYNIDICGINVSDGGHPLTDDQMKLASSFYGWTSGNWTIDQENDYPRLAWENACGTTINTDYPGITYSGSGTEDDPYQIGSAEDLQILMHRENDWDKYYLLTSDVNMSGINFYHAVIGHGCEFTGSFDGFDGIKYHIISNLTVSGSSCCGLFGRIGSGGTVANLGLENASVTGIGDYVGGLCGYNNSGSITQCYAIGSISGDDSLGGLCGYNNSGSIIKCYATGSVSGDYSVGGLCGFNDSGSIAECYAIGSVSGDYYVGGLCGYNYSGSIAECYAAGSISGNPAYGLCGFQYGSSAEIYSSFWNIEISEKAIGYNLSSFYPGTITNVQGVTTAEMQMQTYFTDAGWDFISEDDNGTGDTWRMINYPILSWQLDGIEGDGSENEPYVIDNLNDFYDFCLDSEYWTYNKSVSLNCDLDLSVAGVYSEAPIAPYISSDINFQGVEYKGIFKGNGHEISNLSIESENGYLGLFGNILNGSVSDLNISGIINSNGSKVGLLAGGASLVNIDNCHSDGVVLGKYDVGGLIGSIGGYINKSSASCSVKSTGSWAGGLLGRNSGTVEACYSSGNVTSLTFDCGGMIGINSGDLLNSYSSCAVLGSSMIGGLVGFNSQGSIDKCYSAATMPQTNRLFWVDQVKDSIQYSNLKDNAEAMSANGTSPYGVAIDNENFKVYWTGATTGLIHRANLDGTDIEEVIDTNGESPRLIAVDPVDQKVYFTKNNAHYISKVSYDGTGLEYIVMDGVSSPHGIAVDSVNRKMYWTDASTYKVQRADLDGSNIEDLAILAEPSYCITIDSYNSKIYWTLASANYIQRAELNGSNVENVTVPGASKFYGIAVDGKAGKMYFTEISNYKVQCANLNGSNLTDIDVSDGVWGGIVIAEPLPDSVGGIAGINSGTIENSFWDAELCDITSEDNGQVTAQMQNINTFLNAGWDFNAETANGTNNLWHMPYKDTGYPMLFFQRDIPGDLAGSYGIDLTDFSELSSNWLNTYNITDLQTLAVYWLEQ